MKKEIWLERYKNFIASRPVRKGIGLERHHIIPKCFGGADEKANLICLTPREHYLAHRMLARAYDHEGLKYAFFRMSNSLGLKNSKQYDMVRKELSKKDSDIWKDQDFRESKLRERADPSYRQMVLKAQRAAYDLKENRDKCSISNWQRNRQKWLLAQDIWDRWSSNGRPEDRSNFCRVQGSTTNHWNYWQGFHRRFVEQSWVPKEDPAWVNWSGYKNSI